MELGLTFGSVGDFIAIALLIRDISSALDDCRGSVKEYHDLVGALTIFRETLQEVERICDDPKLAGGLSDLCTIALRITNHSQQCLAAFQKKIRKFGPSFSDGGTGNKLKDAARKLQWRLEERDCDKFRTEIAGYTMSLQILLDVSTVRLVQMNHESSAVQVSASEDRLAVCVQESSQSLKGYMGHIGKRILSKLDFVARVGMELKRSTSNIISMMFTISGELASIRSVILRLERPISDEHFTLEDATGKLLPIHLRTITSWEALEYILANRFKGKKGAGRIRRGRYQLQDGATHQEVDRSTEWEDAFLPYQKVAMSLMCIEGQKATDNLSVATCPRCFSASPGETGVEVTCQSCNMHFTRVVEVEDDNTLADAPRHDDIRFGEPSFVRNKKRKATDNKNDPESEDTCSECHQPSKRLKGKQSQKRKRIKEDSESESDDEDVRGFVRVTMVRKRRQIFQSNLNFQADHTLSFDTLAQKVLGDIGDRPLGAGMQPSNGAFENDKVPQTPSPSNIILGESIVGRGQRSDSITTVGSTNKRPGARDHKDEGITLNSPDSPIVSDFDPNSEIGQNSNNSDEINGSYETKSTVMPSTRLKFSKARDATEGDKTKHNIPRGYSVKHWDPDEKPIFLSGSVFDYYSIGKWIYDWAVYHSGTPTFIADTAGDLWLGLIELNNGMKKCDEGLPTISKQEDREIIQAYLETGERLMGRFRRILKTGDDAMAVARTLANGENKGTGKFFIDAIFEAEADLAKTEAFINRTKLWKLRFDANCSDILKTPSND